MVGSITKGPIQRVTSSIYPVYCVLKRTVGYSNWLIDGYGKKPENEIICGTLQYSGVIPVTHEYQRAILCFCWDNKHVTVK